MTILYSYNAALYCEACGERIRAELTAQGKAPPDPDAEDTYDSGDFPKSSVSGESDTIDFCDAGEHCADPFVLSDGRKVGQYLDQDLTTEGVESLKAALDQDRSRPLDSALASLYREIADAQNIDIPPPFHDAIKRLLRKDGTLPAFSTVGAYTLAYHTESGETLCAKCAADPANDAAFCDTYYEGPTIYCDGCNAEIESSYGDPDDKSDE